MKTVKIGDHVIYNDEYGVPHDALVTNCWSSTNPGAFEYDETQQVFCAINIVYVVKDKDMRDQYGNQTKHESSVSHKSVSNVSGRTWYQP